MASFSEMFLDSFAVLGMLAKLVAVLQTVGCLLGSDTCEKELPSCFGFVLAFGFWLISPGSHEASLLYCVFKAYSFSLHIWVFNSFETDLCVCNSFFFFSLHFLIEVPQPQYHLLGLEDFTFFVNEF